MSFGKDSSLKFVMEGSELVNLARSDVTADKQPLDSVEEEVWRIFREHKALLASHEKLVGACNKSKEIFSKKLRLIRAKESESKDAFAFIESRYWSGVYNNIFELRQEIERMLDKLKLNEFCILSAFKEAEKIT